MLPDPLVEGQPTMKELAANKISGRQKIEARTSHGIKEKSKILLSHLGSWRQFVSRFAHCLKVQGNAFNNQNKVVKWAGIFEFLVDTTNAVNGHLFDFDLDTGKNLFLFFV